MSDPSAQTSARPGTQFFAPQARLVTESGQAIEIDRQPISADLISVTATLVNNGIGQVEIVLNNQRHDSENRIVAPIWRYNKLDPVSFGSRIRVDIRYGNEGWTPMVLARVTDVAFLFPPTAGAQLTLKGEDLLSLLKAKPEKDVSHKDKTEIQMVEEELRLSETGLSLAGDRSSPFSAPLHAVTHEKSKTYQQFIESLGERMDFELFVEFDDTGPMQGTGSRRPVSLHFEAARSGRLDKLVDLQWGRDIVEFKPTFKVWEVLTDAVASGTARDVRKPFKAAVTMAEALSGELHAAPGGGSQPITAATARERAFRAENRPPANSEAISVTNLDEARAQLQAKAALRRSARQFLTADITTIGFTKLRPGIHVNLTGLYAPFDGVYYVTQTVHTLSSAVGYSTKCSLRRPGMLDPSGYPGGAR